MANESRCRNRLAARVGRATRFRSSFETAPGQAASKLFYITWSTNRSRILQGKYLCRSSPSCCSTAVKVWEQDCFNNMFAGSARSLRGPAPPTSHSLPPVLISPVSPVSLAMNASRSSLEQRDGRFKKKRKSPVSYSPCDFGSLIGILISFAMSVPSLIPGILRPADDSR